MILQVQQFKEVLSIEYISVVGLLLAVIFAMGLIVRYLINRIDRMESEHTLKMKDKDDRIMDLAIKYYTLSDKVYTILKIERNV